MMKKVGCTIESMAPFKLINVYECENCKARVKFPRTPKECINCERMIKEHHLEEGAAGIL